MKVVSANRYDELLFFNLEMDPIMNPEYYQPLDTCSLEDLERLASVVSVESAAGGLMVDPRQRLGQFFRKASGFFNKLTLPAVNFAILMPRDMVSYVGKVGYMEAANKNIIVPESFIGQWVPYSAALLDATTKAIQIEAMVKALNATLGRVINDPTLLQSASGLGHTGAVGVGLNEAMVDIGKTYFDPRSNHIHRTLGAVVERSQDIVTTHNNLNEAVALDKAHPAKVVVDLANRSMVLADKVMPLVDESGKASRVAVNELIGITLALAKEMEAYGTLLYRLRQFGEALKDSMKELRK